METDFTYPNINVGQRRQPSYGPSTSYAYPQVGQPVAAPPPYGRPPPPIPTPASSRLGIKVQLKPEYRIAPPPQLLPLMGDIPHSSFQFDFDFERKVLEKAEEAPTLNGTIHSSPSLSRLGETSSTAGSVEDPVVVKYTAMGLNKEAVGLAIATYGDVQSKVLDFVSSYNVLREMGFAPDAVAGALAMYDNDKERALAHLVG